MGQIVPVINKIKRNLDMMGIANTESNVGGQPQVTITSTGAVIAYQQLDLKAPLGGVDPSVSPFLGIAQANPGQITLQGAAGQDTLGAILVNSDVVRAFGMICGFANDKIVLAGDTSAQLAYVEGHETLFNMGQ